MAKQPWRQRLQRAVLGAPAWLWRTWRAFHREPWRVASVLFSSLLTLALGYRVAMIWATNAASVETARPVLLSWREGLAWLGHDLLLVTWLAGGIWLLLRGVRSLSTSVWRSLLEALTLGLTHLALLLLFVGFVVHYQLMTTLHSGLTYDVIVESTSGDLLFTLRATPLWVWPALLLPWLLFWLLLVSPPVVQRWRHRLVVGFCILVLALQGVSPSSSAQSFGPEYRSNPLMYAASDILRHLRRSDASDDPAAAPPSSPSPAAPSDTARTQRPRRGSRSQTRGQASSNEELCRPTPAQMKAPTPITPTQKKAKPSAPSGGPLAATRLSGKGAFVTQLILPAPRQGPLPRRVSLAQMRSLKLVEWLWADHQQPNKRVPALKQRWNVLFVLMESTGRRYIFDRSRGNDVPMPFLQKLSRQGWWLRNHFSPSNSSPRSAFSIFSGLYPRPQMKMFSTQRNNHVPSLATWLGRTYDKFLVNPSPLGWFFPRYFLFNSGLRELYGFHSLPDKQRAPGVRWARDERKSFAFFMERLKKAKEPFFATYWSFIAHWPYPDYGKSTHVLPPTHKIHRYYNNLRLLDQHIEQIFALLKKTGRLERTIVVIVGDHGQAFGQHRGNWAHSRRSYNENYQTPALLWQPRLFAPRTIDFYTSHVDILPTLLDAMHIPYSPWLIQGESLWQTRLRRRYLFLYGNENTLSTLSYSDVKLQYSFRSHTCWVYDLQHDPHEEHRLNCRDYPVQRQATLLFRRYQTDILQRYNDASRRGRPFFGLRHSTNHRR